MSEDVVYTKLEDQVNTENGHEQELLQNLNLILRHNYLFVNIEFSMLIVREQEFDSNFEICVL